MRKINSLFLIFLFVSTIFISDARKLKRESLTDEIDMLYQDMQQHQKQNVDPDKAIEKVRDLIEKYKLDEAKFKDEYRPQLEECKNIDIANAEIEKVQNEVYETKKLNAEKCENLISSTNERRENLKQELENLKVLASQLQTVQVQTSFTEFDWQGSVDIPLIGTLKADALLDQKGAEGSISFQPSWNKKQQTQNTQQPQNIQQQTQNTQKAQNIQQQQINVPKQVQGQYTLNINGPQGNINIEKLGQKIQQEFKPQEQEPIEQPQSQPIQEQKIEQPIEQQPQPIEQQPQPIEQQPQPIEQIQEPQPQQKQQQPQMGIFTDKKLPIHQAQGAYTLKIKYPDGQLHGMQQLRDKAQQQLRKRLAPPQPQPQPQPQPEQEPEIIEQPESGVIEQKIQEQKQLIEQEKEEQIKFQQQIVEEIQQAIQPQGVKQEEVGGIFGDIKARITSIEVRLKELNDLISGSDCVCCDKVDSLEEPEYDEKIVLCKEVEDKIFIHFEKKKENAQKIGEIIAAINNNGPVPEYIVKNYNEIYKNLDEDKEQDTFLVKEPIIGRMEHL